MPLRPILICCLSLLWCVLASNAFGQSTGWISLFDGRSLAGFTQRGGDAVYTIDGNEIVGTSVPNTPNSFLCTRDYGDFVLEYEFKVHPELNSGVQIRSHSLPDYRDGRVHGYQVEIDPSDRGWTTGIYDEARRGWLNSLEFNTAARYAFKQHDWNHVRVQAIGDSIKTWLNGVPAADLVDSLTLSGFIALQVHGVGDRQDPVWVRWRNLRIRELGMSRWRAISDGATLAGWKPTGGGTWAARNGVISGRCQHPGDQGGMLVSQEEFDDFTVQIVFKLHSGSSALHFLPKEGSPSHGFQAKIEASESVGRLYSSRGSAWGAAPNSEVKRDGLKKAEWNQLNVSAHRGRIVVHLNGEKTDERFDASARGKGQLGLALGAQTEIEFKSIEILASDAPRPSSVHHDGQAVVVDPYAPVRTLHEGFAFTEGPAPGPRGDIYFSDIPNERIHRYDVSSGKLTVHREGSGRANGLMFGPSGALLACEGGSRRLTRQALGGEVSVLADAFDGKKLNSPNDLALDGKGGIYFTDPRYGDRGDMEMEVEGVYYVPRRGEIVRVIGDMVRPNGLVLSLDRRTLFVADNGAKTIWKYDVNQDGSLANGSLWVDMARDCNGGGDGMTIDERGNIYCAGAGAVWVWNPSGELLTSIRPPESPANCVFGGPDGKTLFITARKGFFSVKMNVAGGR